MIAFPGTVKPAMRMRDWSVMEGPLLITFVLFDIIKYTSDERPSVFKDCFLVAFKVVSHCRFHYICGAENQYKKSNNRI